jgi:hypothetical protein
VRRAKLPIASLDSNLTSSPTMIVVLAVRTYAVWNKDKRVGIGLALLLGFCQIPNAVIADRFIHGIEREYRLDFSSLFFILYACRRVLKNRPTSHTESVPRTFPGMYGCSCHEAHFRELGGIHRDGRRYATYHLILRPLLIGIGTT